MTAVVDDTCEWKKKKKKKKKQVPRLIEFDVINDACKMLSFEFTENEAIHKRVRSGFTIKVLYIYIFCFTKSV